MNGTPISYEQAIKLLEVVYVEEEKNSSYNIRGFKIGDAKFRLSKNSDAEDFKEIFGVVRKEVPALIRDLMDVVYSPESAEKMAKSVATFYKTLVESGINEKDALEMAKGFVIDFRNLTSVFKNK